MLKVMYIREYKIYSCSILFISIDHWKKKTSWGKLGNRIVHRSNTVQVFRLRICHEEFGGLLGIQTDLFTFTLAGLNPTTFHNY